MDWKKEAEALYKKGFKITNIAKQLGKSRKTVSAYINSLVELADINTDRKVKSAVNRQAYKCNWKKSNLAEAAMLKRQHQIDVMVLSREQYFNE